MTCESAGKKVGEKLNNNFLNKIKILMKGGGKSHFGDTLVQSYAKLFPRCKVTLRPKQTRNKVGKVILEIKCIKWYKHNKK